MNGIAPQFIVYVLCYLAKGLAAVALFAAGIMIAVTDIDSDSYNHHSLQEQGEGEDQSQGMACKGHYSYLGYRGNCYHKHCLYIGNCFGRSRRL